MKTKTETFNIRMDKETRNKLEKLAQNYNLTPSSVVRMLIEVKTKELGKEAENNEC